MHVNIPLQLALIRHYESIINYSPAMLDIDKLKQMQYSQEFTHAIALICCNFVPISQIRIDVWDSDYQIISSTL